MEVYILLNTFDKIKKFVDITTHLEYELDLISGRYVVDGKSILGVFSLDLIHPIQVNIPGQPDYYPVELSEFIIEKEEENK